MARTYDEIKEHVLKDVAELMCTTARTAPKTRGKDNLIIIILDANDKKKVVDQMRKIAARDNRPSCERDATSLEAAADQVVVIGTKKETLGLNCGYCGYPNCAELLKTKGVCAYNSMDLGIALGAAVAAAGAAHVDNRVMFSIGKAALELGLLGKEAIQAIGIPLSATSKNPYFDRK